MNFPEFPSPEMYALLASRHGHYCPMSTLGVRIGWAAQRRLDGPPESAVYGIQTCAVDGIGLALNAADIQVDAQGSHRLLVAEGANRWRIELNPQSLELAASYRRLEKDSERDALLESLRTAAESSLLLIERVLGA